MYYELYSYGCGRIQIYCAVITYCLAMIMREKLKIRLAIYKILRIFSPSLLDKTPIMQLLSKSGESELIPWIRNNLLFNYFKVDTYVRIPLLRSSNTTAMHSKSDELTFSINLTSASCIRSIPSKCFFKTS